MAEILKKEESVIDPAISVFRQAISRIPFLKLNKIELEAPNAGNLGRADFVATVNVGKEQWTIVGEHKLQGQLRQVRSAVLQLKHYLAQMPGTHKYGVILAPFISEESAQVCLKSGIGFMDLAGNCSLSFDHVFVETRSANNPFRSRRGLRSLFTPKAARVIRILLGPPIRAWKVMDLQEAAGVSIGHVSNVRKLLLDQEWAVVEEDGLRIVEPEKLLRAWGEVYKPTSETKESSYTALHGDRLVEAMRHSMSDGASKHTILASFSAARWLAPYVRQGTSFFYADSAGRENLRQQLKLEQVGKGENVVIIVPKENGVFLGRVEAAPGIWCTSPVQTWLDLVVSGERGGEAAEHLLTNKLLPAWRENGR